MIPILYNIPHWQTPRDNNGKSIQCASAASCGAASSTVTRGEIGSSNFSDRVVERYGNIPEDKPADPNYLGSFTTENGEGAKGEMGESSEGTRACSENKWLGSCKAYYVGLSPQEDCGGTAGTVGEGTGGEEEGGLEPAESITRIVLDSYSSEEYRQLCCLWSMPSVKACAPVHSFEGPTFLASIGWPVRPRR
jgi:hypothetical protein